MNEEKRREEILAAETAIRELARRMAEASTCTKQADMARNTLESTIRSLEEVNVELRILIESEKKAAETGRRSLDRSCESLDANVKKLQKAQESLEKEADHLEISLGERTRELQQMVESNLYGLSRGVNEIHDELSANSERLEAFIGETNQNSRESADTKLNGLLKNLDAVSNKLLFIMDQNEASARRVQAVERSIKGLSAGLQDIGNRIQSNSGEIEELKMGVTQFNKRLLSLEQVTAAKTSGISNRLRSALAGGLGVITAITMLKFL
jgi:chromosome segregation ATPase